MLYHCPIPVTGSGDITLATGCSLAERAAECSCIGLAWDDTGAASGHMPYATSLCAITAYPAFQPQGCWQLSMLAKRAASQSAEVKGLLIVPCGADTEGQLEEASLQWMESLAGVE